MKKLMKRIAVWFFRKYIADDMSEQIKEIRSEWNGHGCAKHVREHNLFTGSQRYKSVFDLTRVICKVVDLCEEIVSAYSKSEK